MGAGKLIFVNSSDYNNFFVDAFIFPISVNSIIRILETEDVLPKYCLPLPHLPSSVGAGLA